MELVGIALKGTVLVPKFMVRNLLVSILLIIQTQLLSVVCPTRAQFKTLQSSVIRLENSVINLENLVKELSEKLYETQLRLQNVEECDCFKSCLVNGTLHSEGSSWKQDCDICSCVHGEVKCRPIHCSIPCKNPEMVANECCPVCKKTCYLNGQVLQHGQRIKISPKIANRDKCGECVCNDGKTSCKQIIAETMCPQLDCPINEQFTREDQCCRFCAGADFCSVGNDCHSNATCHNLHTEYICSCNKGFKGDGKVCEDLNECDQKGGNDGHHCGQNTICVNTLGSYKCECLPSFRRHNKFECIDIDECSKEVHECNENAICVNTPGGYECLCKPGYERQGLICKRKDISNTK